MKKYLKNKTTISVVVAIVIVISALIFLNQSVIYIEMSGGNKKFIPVSEIGVSSAEVKSGLEEMGFWDTEDLVEKTSIFTAYNVRFYLKHSSEYYKLTSRYGGMAKSLVLKKRYQTFFQSSDNERDAEKRLLDPLFYE